MTTVAEIVAAAKRLPPRQLLRLRKKLDELETSQWEQALDRSTAEMKGRKITDAVIEKMTEWQNRPVYPVVFIDAINVKIRDGAVRVQGRLGGRGEGTQAHLHRRHRGRIRQESAADGVQIELSDDRRFVPGELTGAIKRSILPR